jgi:hypothetical protein
VDKIACGLKSKLIRVQVNRRHAPVPSLTQANPCSTSGSTSARPRPDTGHQATHVAHGIFSCVRRDVPTGHSHRHRGQEPPAPTTSCISTARADPLLLRPPLTKDESNRTEPNSPRRTSKQTQPPGTSCPAPAPRGRARWCRGRTALISSRDPALHTTTN